MPIWQRREKVLDRREFLGRGLSYVLGFFGAGLWIGSCARSRPETRPNVVLIVLDTARADRFSCMGYGRPTSPNIDALAAEGTLFKKAYTTDFWTLPSHASLLTGLYPSQAGATSETLHLPSSTTTLAEILKTAGYDTAGFVCNPWVSYERGFAEGFTDYYEMWRPAHIEVVPEQFGRTEWAALKKVEGWIDRRSQNKKPFFVFINLNCCHLPYQPPEPFLSQFITKEFGNDEVNRVAEITSMWAHLAGEMKLAERDFRIMGDLYDGEVAFADHCVGQIAGRLRQAGLFDRTLFIVTSDHGENLGEHGLIDHLLSMYETTLHVPLVARYSAALQPQVNEDFVSIVDITPTVLDLCGVSGYPDTIKPRQRSLAQVDRERRTFVVAENERPMTAIALMKDKYPSFDTRTIDYRMRAIRTDSHKLIWRMGQGTEFFDLQQDGRELYNLADAQKPACDKLLAMLNDWMEKTPAAGGVSALESQDKQSTEALRSLGYVK